jgi:uncharacterized phage protein gp47/JayE
MDYVAPYINESGLHLPSYPDILAMFISGAQSIYGADIYLGTDSADYQMLSAVALAANDAMGAVQLAYNNRGPLTALGSGLDQVIKLNGMKRNSASYSICTLTLTGTPSATINNCSASDGTYQWALPVAVTFDGSGNASVSATCATIGAIHAAIGTINQIATPTIGWLTVNNAVAADAGLPVESDSSVKSRQTTSTELPSQTLLAGTKGALLQVAGVSRLQVYENYTDYTDALGNPPHSITCVVEGGTDDAIASTIYINKGPGCNPNGTTSVSIYDPAYNYPYVVKFYRPTYEQIYSAIQIHGLTGYSSSQLGLIQAAVMAYINGLSIGEEVTVSALYAVCLSITPSLQNPQFSVKTLTIGTTAIAQYPNDIAIPPTAVAQVAALSQIVVTAI